MKIALLVLALRLLGTAQEDPALSLSPELKRHQGTWRVVSFVYNGTEAEPGVMASIRRKVDGSRVVWSRDGKSFSATGLELDPNTRPPAIDLIPEGGPRRGEHVPGIYRLEGDLLTICMADPDDPRPDSFEAPAGSRRTLMTLERERERPAAIDPDRGKVENQIDLSRFVKKSPVMPRGGDRASMLSQTVEYALRAVVHLANLAPDAATTDQIAQVTRVPKAYLSKVLQSLVRGGIVRSQRGLGGGMTLVNSPSKLTLLDVVNAVEPIQRIRTCPLGLPSHGANLCPLHRRLDEALGQVESAFGSTVLGELLAEPNSSVPLCEFPANAPGRKPVTGRRGRPAAARGRTG